MLMQVQLGLTEPEIQSFIEGCATKMDLPPSRVNSLLSTLPSQV